jgi:hypothetical protein
MNPATNGGTMPDRHVLGFSATDVANAMSVLTSLASTYIGDEEDEPDAMILRAAATIAAKRIIALSERS